MHAGFHGHVYHRHSHDTYSLGVTESGEQAFRCRGAAHVSTAGLVMAFNPDDPHDGHAATGNGFTYRMIHLAPALLTGLLTDLTGAASGLPLFAEPVLGDPALAAALQRLTARDQAAAADRVREFLQGGGAEATLADVASAAGCSRFAAYRAFRGRFGLSPSEYQRQMRLRTARRALASGTGIAAAAALSGFADQAHLTRWFRRCYGITPGAYRAACAGHGRHPAG